MPLLVVTVVVLAVSIVGIPLLLLIPFAVALAVVLMIIGFTGVACVVGRFVSQRMGIGRSPYLSVALGVWPFSASRSLPSCVRSLVAWRLAW